MTIMTKMEDNNGRRTTPNFEDMLLANMFERSIKNSVEAGPTDIRSLWIN